MDRLQWDERRFRFGQRSNLGAHLGVGVMHQLDGTRRTFSNARTTALADRGFDVRRTNDLTNPGQV